MVQCLTTGTMLYGAAPVVPCCPAPVNTTVPQGDEPGKGTRRCRLGRVRAGIGVAGSGGERRGLALTESVQAPAPQGIHIRYYIV